MQKGKLGQGVLTTKDVQTNTNIDGLLHSRIGFQDFEALQTSPDYKNKLKKNIFAMIRQLGPPTLFSTFFAAERQWPNLITCLLKLHNQAKGKEQ